MKKIQPFTIGTKLSVPFEKKCPDYVGIVLPVPAVDCCEVRNKSNNESSPFSEETVSTPHGSSHMEELSEEEDRDSASPSASRSIRKIAMCVNTESQKNRHVSNLNTNNTNGSSEKLFPVEEGLSDRTASRLETDSWTRGQKIKTLHCDCSMPAFPHDPAEDVSHSQRRDLKDFENSLIQLTTSLDLSQEEPKMSFQKKMETGDLGLEMLRRRPTPGEHPDKTWLKLRSLLQDYHQDLMLALEVSSFYQQADNIISAINCKRNRLLTINVHKISHDKESREIACQINMLNESVSRLSNLHPVLARRVTFKQTEVQENWDLLQALLRSQKTDVCSKHRSSSPSGSPTTCPDSPNVARNEGLSVMGKDVKEEKNRLRGFECSPSIWAHKMWSQFEECSVGSQGSESSCSKLDSISEKQDMDRKSCIGQMFETTFTPSNKHLTLCKMSNESTASSETAPLRLKDNTNVSDAEEQSQEQKIQELLSQVEVLWDALQKKYGENDEMKPAETIRNKAEQIAPDSPLCYPLPESVEEGSSGMLARFLELLDHKISLDVSNTLNSPETAEASETSLGLPTDGERSQKFDQTTEELQISLSTLTLRINQHLSRCAELSMDLLDMETDLMVLWDSDLSAVDGLHEQQDDLEAHYHIIEGEVKKMETLAGQLQVSSPEQRDLLREEIQAILQAWEEAGRNMAENRSRLEKFHQIQDYFENYLALITWTENSRSCLLTGNPAWRESEITEIDLSIETKLDEFNRLTAAAQTLVQEENAFTNMIKERTDELQSMLGWIQVNWLAQKEQLKDERNTKINVAGQQEVSEIPLKTLSSEHLCITNTEGTEGLIKTEPCQNTFEKQQRRHDVSSVVTQESCVSKTSVGSSICLILSFDERSAGINQVTKQPSPNSTEPHCIQNAVTIATQNKHVESTRNVQVNSGQHSNNIDSRQQSQDMLQMGRNGSIIIKESCCINRSLNDDQSPCKEEKPSDVFPAIIQHLSCNRLAEHLQPAADNQTHSQFSSDAVQMQEPERSVMQQLSHQSLQINQQPTSGKNDHMRPAAAAEVTHRVFTYLHVSDSYRSADQGIISPPQRANAEDAITPAVSCASLSSTHPASISACDVTPEAGTVCHQNRFKVSSVVTLQEPIRSLDPEQRRHSMFGIVGLERSGKFSSIFRQRCNTWPDEKKRRVKSQENSKLQVFVKKKAMMVDSVVEDKFNSVSALGDGEHNTSKTPSGPVQNICSYLSLGSTLTFSLPKCFSVSDLENKEVFRPAVIYNNSSDLNNQSLPLVQTVLKPHPAIQIEPAIHTEQSEVNFDSACKAINKQDLEDTEKTITEVENHQLNNSTESVVMQEEIQMTVECTQRRNKHKQALNSNNVSVVIGSPSASQRSPPSLCSAACGHKCPSVHTKIKDLNSHLYYTTSKYMKINSPAVLPPWVLCNGPDDSGCQKRARTINCGVRGCAVCFIDAFKETEDAAVSCVVKPDIGSDGVLQPGHWLFQQEEEELEDIWRGRAGNLTADRMVETNTDEETGLSVTNSRGPVSLPLHG